MLFDLKQFLGTQLWLVALIVAFHCGMHICQLIFHNHSCSTFLRRVIAWYGVFFFFSAGLVLADLYPAPLRGAYLLFQLLMTRLKYTCPTPDGKGVWVFVNCSMGFLGSNAFALTSSVSELLHFVDRKSVV